MNIGVIGLGYWGPNYVKAMHLNAKVKKIKLFDLSTANTQKAFEISNKCEIDRNDILHEAKIKHSFCSI